MEHFWLPLPDTKPATIIDADEMHGCKWPVGEHPIMYCNAYAERGKKHLYCTRHLRMSYRHMQVTT